MTGASFQGFLPVEVVAEVLSLGIFAFDDFAAYPGVYGESRPERLSCVFIFGDAFSYDVLGSL